MVTSPMFPHKLGKNAGCSGPNPVTAGLVDARLDADVLADRLSKLEHFLLLDHRKRPSNASMCLNRLAATR